MELKVKRKFLTTSKVKKKSKSFLSHFEKIIENYDKKYIFGNHEALKIYGAPKLYTVM